MEVQLELQLEESISTLQRTAQQLALMASADRATITALYRAALRASGDTGAANSECVSFVVVPASVLYLPNLASVAYDPVRVVAHTRHVYAMQDRVRRRVNAAASTNPDAAIFITEDGAKHLDKGFWHMKRVVKRGRVTPAVLPSSFAFQPNSLRAVVSDPETRRGRATKRAMMEALKSIGVLNRWVMDGQGPIPCNLDGSDAVASDDAGRSVETPDAWRDVELGASRMCGRFAPSTDRAVLTANEDDVDAIDQHPLAALIMPLLLTEKARKQIIEGDVGSNESNSDKVEDPFEFALPSYSTETLTAFVDQFGVLPAPRHWSAGSHGEVVEADSGHELDSRLQEHCLAVEAARDALFANLASAPDTSDFVDGHFVVGGRNGVRIDSFTLNEIEGKINAMFAIRTAKVVSTGDGNADPGSCNASATQGDMAASPKSAISAQRRSTTTFARRGTWFGVQHDLPQASSASQSGSRSRSASIVSVEKHGEVDADGADSETEQPENVRSRVMKARPPSPIVDTAPYIATQDSSGLDSDDTDTQSDDDAASLVKAASSNALDDTDAVKDAPKKTKLTASKSEIAKAPSRGSDVCDAVPVDLELVLNWGRSLTTFFAVSEQIAKTDVDEQVPRRAAAEQSGGSAEQPQRLLTSLRKSEELARFEIEVLQRESWFGEIVRSWRSEAALRERARHGQTRMLPFVSPESPCEEDHPPEAVAAAVEPAPLLLLSELSVDPSVGDSMAATMTPPPSARTGRKVAQSPLPPTQSEASSTIVDDREELRLKAEEASAKTAEALAKLAEAEAKRTHLEGQLDEALAELRRKDASVVVDVAAANAENRAQAAEIERLSQQLEEMRATIAERAAASEEQPIKKSVSEAGVATEPEATAVPAAPEPLREPAQRADAQTSPLEVPLQRPRTSPQQPGLAQAIRESLDNNAETEAAVSALARKLAQPRQHRDVTDAPEEHLHTPRPPPPPVAAAAVSPSRAKRRTHRDDAPAKEMPPSTGEDSPEVVTFLSALAAFNRDGPGAVMPTWLSKLNLSRMLPSLTPSQFSRVVAALIEPNDSPSSTAVKESLTIVDILSCKNLNTTGAARDLLRLVNAADALRHLNFNESQFSAPDSEMVVNQLYDAMDRKVAKRAVAKSVAAVAAGSVSSLDLSKKAIGDDMVHDVVAAIQLQAARLLVDGRSVRNPVRSVDLSGNLITDEVAKFVIAELLSSPSPVVTLCLEGNCSVSSSTLSEATERCSSRKRRYLSHGDPNEQHNKSVQ